MPWPQVIAYSEALQSPRQCFEIPGLAQGQVTTTPDDIPYIQSGDSACVFQMTASSSVVAVRCFTGQVTDQQARYAALQEYLSGFETELLVDFQYVEQGIRIRDEWYPIVMMDWANGDTLDRFIAGHIDQPVTLRDLADRWRTLNGVLRTLRIAHNDLEHGNIIVDEAGELRLVDYDSMFLPKYEGEGSPELGHRNYRHPSRDYRNYDEAIDNFPLLVIYLSLLALAADPGLWGQFHSSDSLILTREDFINPARSNCIEALGKSPDPNVAELAARLQRYCSRPLSQMPDLESVLSDLPEVVQPATPVVLQQKTQPTAEPPMADPESVVSNPQLPPSAQSHSRPAPSPVQNPSPSVPVAPVSESAVQSAHALLAEPERSKKILMRGKLTLGLMGFGFLCLLLTGLIGPAFHVFIVVASLVVVLIPFQARFALRLPNSAVMVAGSAIYFFSVVQNGTFGDPFDPLRDTTLESVAAFVYGIGIAVFFIDFAARLLGYSKPPETATDTSVFIAGMGLYDVLGALLVAGGIPLFIIGLAPQEIIDSFFYEPYGTGYFRASGIRQEAAVLFWPMMVLDKIEFIGAFSFFLGIVILLLGLPRRILFALIMRRARSLLAADEKRKTEDQASRKVGDAEENVSSPIDEAYVIQFGIALIVFGFLTFVFVEQVIERFLIPTILEIGVEVTRNYAVLYTTWGDYPWWLKALLIVLRVVGAIAGMIGALLVIVHLRTFQRSLRATEKVLEILDELLPDTPMSSGGVPPTPGSGGTPTPTAHGGMMRLARGGRGGRGGR